MKALDKMEHQLISSVSSSSSSNLLERKFIGDIVETASMKRDAQFKEDRRKLYEVNNILFQNLPLIPELLHAIKDCGFEHPTEGFKSKENLKKK
jgi:superfamily II DNA/RNA helicase